MTAPFDDRMPSWTRRAPSPSWLIQAIQKRLWYRLELRFYLCRITHAMNLAHPPLLRRDCFEDLRHYERFERDQLSTEEHRRESARRRSLGYHLYTLADQGRLLYYGWLVDRQERSEDPLLGQVFFPPSDSSILFDCFVHPLARGHGLYYRALCQMLHDARDLAGAAQACMGAFADNLASRHVIEKAGFRYIGSMIKERRLWLSQRYTVSAAPEFRTGLL